MALLMGRHQGRAVSWSGPGDQNYLLFALRGNVRMQKLCWHEEDLCNNNEEGDGLLQHHSLRCWGEYSRASCDARGDTWEMLRWFKEKWGVLLPETHFNTALWAGHVDLLGFYLSGFFTFL